MKSRIVTLIIALVSLLIILNRNKPKENQVFHWDAANYYAYLPAVFIYHDLAKLSFYPAINQQYRMTSPDLDYYGIYFQENTGRALNKYAIGVAVFELPFFLIAHLLTLVTEDYPPDGYSNYYELGIFFANAFWGIIGLILLRRFLTKYFHDTLVATTILILFFGTNLYYYTAFDAGMSHVFSFAAFAGALRFTDLAIDTKKLKHLLLASVCLGLVIITRPSNAVLFILITLWGIASLNDLKIRIRWIQRNIRKVTLAGFVVFVILALQLTYWKYITGRWIYFSYEEEGFNFLQPEIWKGLFSYRKGWLLYTPLAAVALAGILVLRKSHPRLFLPIVIYLLVNIYTVFSWHQWYYGGSFGCRALIESYVVLALPLAYSVKWIKSSGYLVKTAGTLVISLFVVLNVWQTYQFSLGTLPTDHINREFYWKVFLKLHRTDEDNRLLDLGEPKWL